MNNRSKVLLVDDDDFSAALVHDVLSIDCDIAHAVDGQAALESIAQTPPDLILLDVQMPGMSGLELCRTLRDNADTQDLPVIFLSGKVTDQDRMAGYEAGGDDYLTKPVSAVDLRSKVKRALQLSADRARIKKNLSEAVSTAMTALSSAAEIGVVMNFLHRSFTCPDYDSLVTEALNVTHAFGVDASIQVRGAAGQISRKAKGICSPLEEEILTNIAAQGSNVDFGNYTAFSHQHATILARNMPAGDTKRYGRVKDHLSLLLEAVNARLAALDHASAVTAKPSENAALVENVIKELEGIRGVLNKTPEEKAQIQEVLSRHLESTFAQLRLTQSIEDELVELTNKAFNEALVFYGVERFSGESIAALLAQLKRV
jgi:DNA-binding response OmpR family regulator